MMVKLIKKIIQGKKRILFLGLLLGIGFWFVEGVLHIITFHKWDLADAIIPPETHEFWMRSLVTCMFIGFGFYVQLIVNKLHESRERYRALFENTPDAILLTDSESGQILDANPAASDLLLRPHEEIIKLHQFQLHPPSMEEDSKRIFTEYIEHVRQENKVRPLEYVALRSDGVEVPVEITAQIVHIEGKQILQGIFRDVKERKKAQNELENSNERFRTVLDSLDALVYVSDMDTHEILFANKYGRDIWGDINGKTCWKTLQSGQSGPCEFCTNDRLLDDNGEPTGLHRWEFQNTVDHQWYDCHDQAIPWMDGRLVRMEIATNITDQKETEKALQTKQKETEALLAATRAIPEKTTFEEASRSIFDAAKGLLGADSGYIALLSADGQQNEVLFLDSGGRPCTVDPNLPMPIRGLRGEAYGKGVVVWENDFMASEWEELMPEGHVALDNTLFAPIIIGGEPVGTIGLANKPGGFAEHDAEMAKAFADISAVGLRFAREQEALRHSEEKYRRVVEDQTEFIVRWLPDGIRTFVNDSYCNYFGQSREELIGSSFFPLISEEDWEKVRKRIEALCPDNPVSTDEHRVIRPDGSIGWNRWTDRAFFDENGRIIEFQSTGSDITERKNAEEALLKSEEKFHKAFYSCPDAITISTLEEGRFIATNEAVTRVLGYAPDEMIGKTSEEFKIWYRANDRNKMVEMLKKDGKIRDQELQFRHKSGEIRHLILSADTIELEDEVCIVTTTRDITERKKAEDELRQYHHIVSSSNDMMALLDNKFVYVAANKSYLEAFNKTSEEVIGRTASEVFGKEFFETVIKPNAERCLSGEEVNFQTWCDFPAYEPRYMDINYYPYIDSNNEVSGFVVNGRNITERRRTENALRQHDEFLRSVLESLTHPFLVINADDYSVDMANSAAWKGELAEGAKCYEVSHKRNCPCDDVEHPCPLEHVKKTGLPMIVEHVHYNQLGIARAVEVHGYPLWDEQSKVTKIIEYCLDVTERKQAEKKLMKNQAHLRSLVSQLTMTEERERKEIAGLLHDDLIQRLAMCKMRVDELSKSKILMDRGSSLDEISESIREMIKGARSLTFDLCSPVLYDIGLEAAIRDWFDREVSGKYDITFEITDDGQQRQLSEDLRVTLYRAVRELCTNVIKHSNAKKAKVSIRSKNDNIEIIVEDDGGGITIDNSTGDSSERGGMGLFGIRERLNHFGTDMNIESEAGAGTKITITIPLNR